MTDEAGFVAINQRGGVSIRIGGPPTAAAYGLPNVPALHIWLLDLLGASCREMTWRPGDRIARRRILAATSCSEPAIMSSCGATTSIQRRTTCGNFAQTRPLVGMIDCAIKLSNTWEHVI